MPVKGDLMARARPSGTEKNDRASLQRAREGQVRQRIRESVATKEKLLDDGKLVRLVGEVSGVITAALRKGRKVLLFGNGGSAADAQHIAAELAGRYLKERAPLPAVALTVNSSTLTAIGNDYGFADVFARQVDALGERGDVAVAISTSGQSANVLRAVERCKSKGLITVGLTGQNGRQLKKLVDYCLCVPSGATPRIQEAHILLGHILCELIESELFPR